MRLEQRTCVCVCECKPLMIGWRLKEKSMIVKRDKIAIKVTLEGLTIWEWLVYEIGICYTSIVST